MKEGMETGQTAEVTATVTPEMFASFEGQVVHPAYSTVSMVYHMEWASRQIILPYLEEDEEGIGGAVTVKHVAPTGAGSVIKVIATLTEFNETVVKTKVEAFNEKGLIGVGEVKQAILKKKDIKKKLESAV
ncbi:thioesterase family protein [Bacillus marinisedimentorum]|uniref:thioesterase family protein n=1 Tax=Bacillus marinisedimentorum TaxID=1821260 RepID=UPI0008732C7D|nr:thioesterase [Bacillus marinisedimentorum]